MTHCCHPEKTRHLYDVIIMKLSLFMGNFRVIKVSLSHTNIMVSPFNIVSYHTTQFHVYNLKTPTLKTRNYHVIS